jgi:hypothetical protein
MMIRPIPSSRTAAAAKIAISSVADRPPELAVLLLVLETVTGPVWVWLVAVVVVDGVVIDGSVESAPVPVLAAPAAPAVVASIASVAAARRIERKSIVPIYPGSWRRTAAGPRRVPL